MALRVTGENVAGDLGEGKAKTKDGLQSQTTKDNMSTEYLMQYVVAAWWLRNHQHHGGRPKTKTTSITINNKQQQPKEIQTLCKPDVAVNIPTLSQHAKAHALPYAGCATMHASPWCLCVTC